MKQFVFILFLIFIGSLNAANYTWTGAGDSLWSNASNWSGAAGYPNSAADDITVDNKTVADRIVLTENIIINDITWNEKKNNRGFNLNGFDLTVDGDVDMATKTKLIFQKSDGQLVLNGDFNMSSECSTNLYNVNQTAGTLNIGTLSTVNILNPTTRVDITLNLINMSDKSFLFFKNTKNVTLSDIDVASFCVVEFPRGKRTTFTSVVDWNEPNCTTFNTFRSYLPGTQATLRFSGGASTGNFNAYEDIKINFGGGGSSFTANSRTDLGNNTSISGTTLVATSCQFDGNGDNTGDWSDASEWDCGCAPRSIDDVSIQANKSVTIDDLYAQCDDFTFAASTSRIIGNNTKLLEIHGNLTTVDEANFEDFEGETEFRNDVIASVETLTCSGCDTVKFYGRVSFEFPGNTWRLSDHIKVIDNNDKKRGDLTVERGILDLNNFDLEFESDLDISDVLITGTGEVRAINEENSTIRIDGTGDLFDLIINKSAASDLVTIRTNVTVTNNLNLTGLGIVTIENTAGDTLILTDEATVLGGSNDCHVNPSMLKIGNDNFTFPIGNGTFYRAIGVADMAGNSTVTDQIYAEYILDSPFNNGMVWGSWSSPINNVSTREYWELDDVLGSPTPKIVLSWSDPNPSDGIGNINDLLVTHWNGVSFDDLGNGSTTGNTSNGTITSNSNVTSFSPFTLASSSSSNALPVELLHFRARLFNGSVTLSWATASEINNDRFIVERSQNGTDFISVATVKGAGNNQQELHYNTLDNELPFGTIYYRLRQIDFDGTQSLSDVQVVNNNWGNRSVIIYQNPVKRGGVVSIKGIQKQEGECQLIVRNMKGQLFLQKRVELAERSEIDFQAPSESGVYNVRILGVRKSHSFKIIVQ